MTIETLIQLWDEFYESNYKYKSNFEGFIDWLKDKNQGSDMPTEDSKPSTGHAEASSHVEGRRYICLTGKEWYERFIKEWNFICKTMGSFPSDPEQIPIIYGRIAKQAARRASGLGDGDD